jgi:hypothetical protein
MATTKASTTGLTPADVAMLQKLRDQIARLKASAVGEVGSCAEVFELTALDEAIINRLGPPSPASLAARTQEAFARFGTAEWVKNALSTKGN